MWKTMFLPFSRIFYVNNLKTENFTLKTFPHFFTATR
jgi:hypothetical protein